MGDDRAAAPAVPWPTRREQALQDHPDDGDAGDHIDGAAMAAAVEAALRPPAPRRQGWRTRPHSSSASPPTPRLLTVEDVARQAGATPGQLQRRFADHVGIGPKAVIRRYRLYEAAARAWWGPGRLGRGGGVARLQRPGPPDPRLHRALRPATGPLRGGQHPRLTRHSPGGHDVVR